MLKILMIATLSLLAAGCAKPTPLPEVGASLVRPLNPTKWDYEAALHARQAKIGIRSNHNHNAQSGAVN